MLPRDPRGKPMTGAAGGLSGGLWAAFGARLVPGAAYVLGLLGFDRHLDDADGAVTGEGRLDSQSLEGKLVGEVAKRCRDAGVPLHAIAGQVDLDQDSVARLGLASAREAGTLDAVRNAARSLAN
jgi:glycerate kinase